MHTSTETLPRYERELDQAPLSVEKMALLGITQYIDPTVLQRFLDSLQHTRNLLVPFTLCEELRRKVAGYVNTLTGRRTELGHVPRRTESPTPNRLFETHIRTGTPSPYRQLLNVIIGCSNFDEKTGRVNRYLQKPFMSGRGATMTLESLTPERIDGCAVFVETVDDMHQEIPYEDILSFAREQNQKVVVSLAGVQTGQYPRALHIAATLRSMAHEHGISDKIDIMIGGFHIRGHKPSRDEAIALGITVADGEVEEGRYGQMLTDVAHDRLALSYKWDKGGGKNGWVALEGNPMPAPSLEKIAPHTIVTLQFARGCPMPCSFCGVKNIDGSLVRPRTAAEVKAVIRALTENGVQQLFISDDNFYRHPHRMEILAFFKELRSEGIQIGLGMQTDLHVVIRDGDKTVTDDKFMDACRDAGVTRVFVGIESFDFNVLTAMKKRTVTWGGEAEFINEMQRQREAWNKRGIAVNGTCIIGNELDRKGVGKRSAEAALKIGVNMLSAFVFGVVPGSDDSKQFAQGTTAQIDPDFNRHDGRHATVQFTSEGALTLKEIETEYRECMDTFYRPENMGVCNSLTSLRTFVWYMIMHRLGRSGMSGGFGKMMLSERKDERAYQNARETCKQFAAMIHAKLSEQPAVSVTES